MQNLWRLVPLFDWCHHKLTCALVWLRLNNHSLNSALWGSRSLTKTLYIYTKPRSLYFFPYVLAAFKLSIMRSNFILCDTFLESKSSKWFWINWTVAAKSAELNSYGIFQPRGPNFLRSCTTVWRNAAAYSIGFHWGMLVTSSWSWGKKKKMRFKVDRKSKICQKSKFLETVNCKDNWDTGRVWNTIVTL